MQFSCSLFSTSSSSYFEKDSLNFPFVCAFYNWVFHSKWHFVSELVFDLSFSFLFWGQENITNFVSIALLIQNTPTFSCAFFIILILNILGFCRLTFESNINFFHPSLNPSFRNSKIMRPFLDNFSKALACYIRVSRWLRYVQVNQLKKPVILRYRDVTLYGNPAKLMSPCPVTPSLSLISNKRWVSNMYTYLSLR